MRYLMILLSLLFITSCASTQVFKSAEQNYRLKSDDNLISIKGAIIKDDKTFTSDFAVGIYFNDAIQIKFNLDNQLNGEGNGTNFKGKSTSATCTGRKVAQNVDEVRCLVFIDNEKTVTLTF